MNPVSEAIKTVNEVLKLAGQELIPMPTADSAIEQLEAILDMYTNKLIEATPQYKKFINKKDIPEPVVMYLNNAIRKQMCKEEWGYWRKGKAIYEHENIIHR